MGDLCFAESLQMLEGSDYSPWVKVIFEGIKSNTKLKSFKMRNLRKSQSSQLNLSQKQLSLRHLSMLNQLMLTLAKKFRLHNRLQLSRSHSRHPLIHRKSPLKPLPLKSPQSRRL